MSGNSEQEDDVGIDIWDLVKLNEELNDLRDNLARKRNERETANREGRDTFVDLTPELEQLNRFVKHLDTTIARLRAIHPLKRGAAATELDEVQQALIQIRFEIEAERKKLEEERAIREHRFIKHDGELSNLRDEFARTRESMAGQKKSLETLRAELSANMRMKSTNQGTDALQTLPSTRPIENGPRNTSLTRSTFPQYTTQPQVPEVDGFTAYRGSKPDNQVILDALATLKLEVEALRFEVKGAYDNSTAVQRGKGGISADTALRNEISDQISSIRSEVRALADRASQRDYTSVSAGKNRKRVLPSKRLSVRKRSNVDLLARQASQQLHTDLLQLKTLKRSLQELRTESRKERRKLERDRTSIVRARIQLEKEKGKVELRKLLLQNIRAKEATRRRDKSKKRKRQPKAPKSLSRQKHRSRTHGPTVFREALLNVKLSDVTYGIEIDRVREVAMRGSTIRVPHQPSYVEGAINIRGMIMPVINLRKRFNLGGRLPPNSSMVILDSSQGLVAALFDSVGNVTYVTRDRIKPPSFKTHGIQRKYVKEVLFIEDMPILHLDIEKVIKDIASIARFYSALRRNASGTSETSFRLDNQETPKPCPTKIGENRLLLKTEMGTDRLNKLVLPRGRKGSNIVVRLGKTRVNKHKLRDKS